MPAVDDRPDGSLWVDRRLKAKIGGGRVVGIIGVECRSVELHGILEVRLKVARER